MKRTGLILFGVGLSGVGILSLIYHGFALAWEPVSTSVPHREFLACISGAILLVGGMGSLLPSTVGWGAFVLAAFVSSWLLVLRLPRVAANPLFVGGCTTFAETVIRSGAEFLWTGLAEK